MCLTRRVMSLRSLLLFLPVALMLTGCAGTSTTPTTLNDVDNTQNNVSNTPWNKPDSWETSGQLGSAMGH